MLRHQIIHAYLLSIYYGDSWEEVDQRLFVKVLGHIKKMSKSEFDYFALALFFDYWVEIQILGNTSLESLYLG